MPAYSLADPVVSVFVILPVLLSGLFALGVYYAWRRAGESRTVTIRAVMTATIGVVAGWRSLPELRRLAPRANGIGTLNL